MLELHIYGPALGLPSVEFRCIAAVILLQKTFPDKNAWALIPSNDPKISPFNELPALKDGNLWITGFRGIVNYIKHRYENKVSKSNLTLSLSDDQFANCEAYISFLESRGAPLLDLSLYVSSDNYTNITRSALSDLLPWPLSWTIPQRLRDEARKRSEHLGLSGLDVDATREKELQKQNEGVMAAIPQTLRVQKKSVTALLGSSAEQTRFRLEAATSDFFEPLELLLGEQDYFLGNTMTILDCFALALLSQMGAEGMPQPWLKEALEKRPRLWKWTRVNSRQTIGSKSLLPWAASENRSWMQIALQLIDSVAESIPVQITTSTIRAQDDDNWVHIESKKSVLNQYEQKQLFYSNLRRQQRRFREVIAAGLSSAGLVGALVYMGILTLNWPIRKSQPTRQGFGEAGRLLGLR